jgi:hypothetical protein
VLQGALPSEHRAQVTCGCGRRGSPPLAAALPAQIVPPGLAIVAPVPQWQALPPAGDTVATVDTPHGDIGLLTYRSGRMYLLRFALYLSMLEEVEQPAFGLPPLLTQWGSKLRQVLYRFDALSYDPSRPHSRTPDC